MKAKYILKIFLKNLKRINILGTKHKVNNKKSYCKKLTENLNMDTFLRTLYLKTRISTRHAPSSSFCFIGCRHPVKFSCTWSIYQDNWLCSPTQYLKIIKYKNQKQWIFYISMVFIYFKTFIAVFIYKNSLIIFNVTCEIYIR